VRAVRAVLSEATTLRLFDSSNAIGPSLVEALVGCMSVPFRCNDGCQASRDQQSRGAFGSNLQICEQMISSTQQQLLFRENSFIDAMIT
jgi:hypothetical protein